MTPYEIVTALAPPGGTMAEAARACFDALDARLAGTGRSAEQTLSLTLFVAARDHASYQTQKESLLREARGRFGETPPPVSVAAQAPAAGRPLALEAAVLRSPARGVRVERRTADGLPYTVVTAPWGRQVHAGGLCSSADAAHPAAQAEQAFAQTEAVLRAEGLTLGSIVRQWSYIEGLLKETPAASGASQQAYQAFNDVRSVAYAASSFPHGYPAATGIGQAAGGVVIDLVALDAPDEVEIAPLSNPRQRDAHRYAEELLVGTPLGGLSARTTPKFERAKRVARGGAELILVSGTASILGEQSVAPGDVREQTRVTLENIAALVGERRLSHLRAYVKHAEDIPVVQEICARSHGRVPSLFVQADVCREELLVEIEGAIFREGRSEPTRRKNGARRRRPRTEEVPL